MTRRHFLQGRILTAGAVAFFTSLPALAQPQGGLSSSAEGGYEAFMAGPDAAMFTVNNLWVLISAALVFIMHLGFSAVESGMCQKKNCVNIMFKNVFVVCIGALTYMIWGFNSMYPGDAWLIKGWLALGSPLANSFGGADVAAKMTSAYAGYTYWTDFIFQAMFAATAATIVSGAVAERVKLSSFMIYATVLVMFFYPITGSWKWGKGWLDAMGFHDFAGSTLVHAFGGGAALAAILVLGARRGKYTKEGVKPVLPHNLPLALTGVFALFIGWFGFNGGSVLSADPQLVSRVFVTTAMAGFAGGLGATFCSWIALKKPDLTMGLNGILAGLVGITAGADVIHPWQAVLVGGMAGVLVVFAVMFFDKVKVDDPVGAVSVHGVCGVFGTLAVGIWSSNPAHSFLNQLIGTLAVTVFAFVASFSLFTILKFTIGVRVDAQEEEEGLDVAEHGAPAYAD